MPTVPMPLCRRLSPLALLLLFAAAFAAAQPAAYTKDTATLEYPGFDGSVDIYRPADGASVGVAIVAHGFTRSRIRHRDLGRALAEAGVTAVIPDLPNVMDLWGNGQAIVELVDKLDAGAFGPLPAGRAHLVLIGTSAGGLATVLAAAKLPGLAGWIGLDPVDRTGTGADAAARLTSPAIVLLAPAAACNLIGSGRSIARAVPGLRRAPVIDGASHCDFEDPTNRCCEAVCGGSTPAIGARIRALAVAAAVELLAEPAATARAAAPAPE